VNFDISKLQGHDFLYFKLHGWPDQPYWYGDNWTTALKAEQLTAAELGGATVFVANCYLPESPMLPALLSAGARAVVGGAGLNYAAVFSLVGADLLGYHFRQALKLGLAVTAAFRVAKWLMRKRTGQAAEDARAFKLWRPGDVLAPD
jgi:hypothetical protein